MNAPIAAASIFSSQSPFDRSALEPVEATAAGDVAALVARAREAQGAWADTPLVQRIEAIFKVRDRILDRGDEIARLLRLEVGKPEAEGWLGEVIADADLVEYWCDAIEEALAPEEVSLDALTYPGKSGQIVRAARGVVGLITPWNFPFAIPLRTLVPALLAGNAVVFKPSEHSPRVGALVAKLFDGLLPQGVLTIVQGAGDVGRAVVGAGVDLVVFTGSVSTGKKIAAACAETLTPVSLELGGKDAAIVLADADLDRAAYGIVWGAFTNAGQNCAGIERVYVDKKVVAQFTQKVVELTKTLRLGDDVGAMTNEAQRAIVERHLELAVADGAKVLCGGQRGEGGLFFQPTVVEVSPESEKTPLMDDETFGPILPIVAVDGASDALKRTNASRYALTTSIWSRKADKAAELAPLLRSGVVTINNHAFTAAIAAAPWTGTGETGYGVTNSKHALMELTRPRFVLIDRASARSELWWMPYTPSLLATARAMAVLRSGSKSILQKVAALFSLLANAPKRLMGK